MEDVFKSKSKFLSLILRHKPETIGLTLDENGWASVDELLLKAAKHNFPLTRQELHAIVSTNDKKRFALSADQSQIRANQGHSIAVDLALKESLPPEYLYHGTAAQNLASIKSQGINKGQRHHVHLSQDQHTAHAVGSRYGKAVVIKVEAKRMAQDHHIFYLSENGVWLTESVPPQFLQLD